MLDRAHALEVRGDDARAIVAFQEATRCQSVAADALRGVARIERERGRLREAAAALTRALHHLQDDRGRSFEVYVELGDIHAQRGDFGEATYYYRRAERYRPGDQALLRRLRSASTLAGSRAFPLAPRSLDVSLPHPSGEWDVESWDAESWDVESWDVEDWEVATA